MNGIYIKNYDDIELNRHEILRYAQCDTDFDLSLIDECFQEIKNDLVYKVCYSVFDINRYGDKLDLEFCSVKSVNLEKNLENCNRIILFAATVGFGIDRLIKKYSVIEPSKSLIFQALGSERVESLCDSFNDEMKNIYTLKPRFSPGYGDLPLSIQKTIFECLNLNKNLGMILNDNMFMSPSKSVTAIIGIINK